MDLIVDFKPRTRHSAIRFVTPAQRHTGLDVALLVECKALYEKVRCNYPRRWSKGTRNWSRIHTVHLNPDQAKTNHDTTQEAATQDKIAA